MYSCQENRIATPVPSGTSAIDTSKWFAIQTRARHEMRIGSELRNKGINAFVPTLHETHRWTDRTKTVEVPLFSCYVFVRIATCANRRLDVLKTAGVFRFVNVNGEAAAIPDSQIDSIKTLIENRFPLSARGFLQIGQRVRIRGGAMDGVVGILERCNGERKLVISVELIQKSVEVTVEGYVLEAA